MSDIATYTFIPWLRQGLANQINGQSGVRATIPVKLVLSGEKVGGGTETLPEITKNIEIYGPGDIAGLDPKAIIKVEPHNWITNFEPNYLPYIDFYDEDLPWRYSPVSPAQHRLAPWMALVVLKENEFKDGKNVKDRPLSYILTNGDTVLPPSDQLWAWAHVHVNKNIIASNFISTDTSSVENALGNIIKSNPDLAYSRIIAPRKLEPNTAYHMFLVPAYESGRLAGLGQDPATAPSASALAWGATVPTEIPYFHRSFFKTGTIGDFEYLVRLLEPKPVDSRVGLRDFDVQKPGMNISGIKDPSGAPENKKLGGILKLGGALKIPDLFYTEAELAVVEKYRHWATLNQPYPHPFQKDVAAFINLASDYEIKSAAQANNDSSITEEEGTIDPSEDFSIKGNPDPLITAPLYGRWHSLTKRLLTNEDDSPVTPNDNWVHELNLDPRWRVSAGFGTKVVQENQEDYMKSAWEQVGEVLESNRKFKLAKVAKEVSLVWHTQSFQPIQTKAPDKWLTIATPLNKRVINQGVTVFHQINESIVPQAVFSTTMRKYTRPRGTLVKRLNFTEKINNQSLITRINEGQITAAPPRVTPEDLNTIEELSDKLDPKGIPAFIKKWLSKYKWLKWVPLALALIILIVIFLIKGSIVLYGVTGAIVAGLIYLFILLNKWSKKLINTSILKPENQTPEAVATYPKSPDFRIIVPGDKFRPKTGNTDSEEAKKFKEALKEANVFIKEAHDRSIPVIKPRLDIAGTAGKVYETLNPAVTIPKWVFGSIFLPDRIKLELPEEFEEAMTYPQFDLPMYKPLADYSSELFLPNINLIAQNSISLLETNQPFIEAYMVGLNHEFARELLWREYPTDQRGSYFRQFWEARGFHNDKNLSPEALKEKLRDIPPLHLWSKYSKLGDHDNREEAGKSNEEVVLVIRGELLKKYPNAVIYAQRALWQDKDGKPILNNDSTKIDPTKERELKPLTPQQENDPPRDIIKTPLFEAKVDPDIYFFGFDLTACQAKGGTGKSTVPVNPVCQAEGITWDDPGWFFVIKERPGEPRFGLDIGKDGDNVADVKVWNDLSWKHINVPDGAFLQINNSTTTIDITNRVLTPQENEKQEQRTEDVNFKWSKDMSSAELAYILYQVPVLVGVHASEMLPKN